MFAENATEEQKKGEWINYTAGTYMPSRPAYYKCKYSTDYPDEKKYTNAQITIKVEQTP